MRRLAAAVLLLAAIVAPAHAEERRYAVLSLLSDQISVVTRDVSTGSRLDRNVRETVPIRGALDKREVLAIDDALRAAGVKPDAVLLFTTDPVIFESQARLLDDPSGVAKLLEALEPVVRPAKATHLILASKYRHEAALQLYESKVGSGRLEGLGFYVDRTLRTTTADSGESGVGFIAPYAYFRLSLVELASGKVLRDIPIYASDARTAARSESGEAWEAMTPEEKVAALERLLKAETARAVPELIR
jgi:hypothetical protein